MSTISKPSVDPAAAAAASTNEAATKDAAAGKPQTESPTPSGGDKEPLACELPLFKPFRVTYVDMRPGSGFDEEYIALTVTVALASSPNSKNEGELTWFVPRTQNAKFLMDRLRGHVKLHGPGATFAEICKRLSLTGEPRTQILGEDYANRQERRANFATRQGGVPITGETRRPARASNPALDNAAANL